MNDRSMVTVAGVCFTTVSLGGALTALPPPRGVVGNVVFRAASSSTHVPEKSGCAGCAATGLTSAKSVNAVTARRRDPTAVLRMDVSILRSVFICGYPWPSSWPLSVASLRSQGRSRIGAQRARRGNPRGQQGHAEDEPRDDDEDRRVARIDLVEQSREHARKGQRHGDAPGDAGHGQTETVADYEAQHMA